MDLNVDKPLRLLRSQYCALYIECIPQMRRNWKLFFHFIFLCLCKSERFNIIYRVTAHGSSSNSKSNILGSVLTLYNYNKTCYEQKKNFCVSFLSLSLSSPFLPLLRSLFIHLTPLSVRTSLLPFFFLESRLGCESFLWFTMNEIHTLIHERIVSANCYRFVSLLFLSGFVSVSFVFFFNSSKHSCNCSFAILAL